MDLRLISDPKTSAAILFCGVLLMHESACKEANHETNHVRPKNPISSHKALISYSMGIASTANYKSLVQVK